MKRLIKLTAFILVLAMLSSAVCFASGASVVSPLTGSIIEGDSYLLSVKLTGSTSVNITVYEERELNASGASISAITDYFTDSASMEGLKTEYLSTGAVTGLYITTLDENSVTGTALVKTYAEEINQETVTYVNSGEMGFYTKQLTGIVPGLYRIEVLTLDAEGNTLEAVNSFIAVKPKNTSAENTGVFETEQGGAVQFLQNLLKSIFQKNN